MDWSPWAELVKAPPPPAWLVALAAVSPASPSHGESRNDSELIARLAARDAQALAELYDRHAGAVYAVCRRMLPPADADEVLSDVFWDLWQRPERYDPLRGTPVAFLTILARSRAADRLRTSGRRSRILDDEEGAVREVLHAGDDRDPFTTTASGELRRHVVAALDSLDARQRRAIELAFYGAMTHTEVAAALGEPLGTVKSWIRQGLIRLRAALAERYGAEASA